MMTLEKENYSLRQVKVPVNLTLKTLLNSYTLPVLEKEYFNFCLWTLSELFLSNFLFAS